MESSARLRRFIIHFVAVAALAARLAADPADPTVGEWKTFGNGPSHTGFYPTNIGTAPITPGWSKSLGLAINQVAVSGNQIFLTTNVYFGNTTYAASLSTADGSEIWRYPLPQAYSVNPPTYDSGRVLFQRCDHASDTYLYALNSKTGGLLWAAPHDAQWEQYQAPTVFGDGVWVNGGYYGGMYGFDLATGAQRFYQPLPQEDGWTPSYYGGVIYSCVSGIFKAFDPRTGSELWTRNLRLPNSSWYSAGVLAIMNNRAFVIGDGSLVAVDLVNRVVLWRVNGAFTGTPATDGDVVYALVGNTVSAYSADAGKTLGAYTASGNLFGQPLILNDAVMAANGTNTFVFDKATFALRTTLATGGALSYTKGILYTATADSSGTLATYVVQLSEPEPAPTPTPSPTATPTVTPSPTLTPTPTATPTSTPTPTASPSPTAKPTPTPGPNPSEPLWVDAKVANSIAYFIFASSAPHLERFDMQANTWLPTITLSGAPTSFAVDSDAIYVSFGRRTARLNLDGTNETALANTVADVTASLVSGDYLYLLYSGTQVSSINKSTGAVKDAKNFFYSMTGLSIAPTKNKIFGRDTGVSP
ncbi:MAG: large repetitive protein, partial [Verrucomicrobiota bacterium]